MSNVKNPFEHILYEIEMYLITYSDSLFVRIGDQFSVNMVLDSRAIHLRNLAYLFQQNKQGQYWYAGDYIKDVKAVHLLEPDLFKTIKEYTSRATCHLLDYRLEADYKKETAQCYTDAFPEIKKAIITFFDALNSDIKDEYINFWEEKYIQSLYHFIEDELLADKKSTTGFTGTSV